MKMIRVILCWFIVLQNVYATTYYVGKTGNDANTSVQSQDPSTPWLTINKALTVIVSGDIVYVDDGTYAENADFRPVSFYTSETLIASKNANKTNVVITGTSGTFNAYLRGSNLTLSNLTFTAKLGTDSATVYMDRGGNNKLINCTISAPDGSSKYGVVIQPASGHSTNIVIDSCLLMQPGTSTSRGINMFSSTVAVSNVLVTNCVIAVSSTGIQMAKTYDVSIKNTSITSTNGVPINSSATSQLTNTLISSCNINCLATSSGDGINIGQAVGLLIADTTATTANGHGIMLGLDANYASATAGLMYGGIISNCIASAPPENGVNHGILLGANCSNCIAIKNIASSGNWAIVVKENNNSTVAFNTAFSGSQSAIYVKGATNAVIANNLAYCTNASSTNAIMIGKGATAPFDHTIVTNNWIICDFSPTAGIRWGPSAEDGVGGICDYNAFFFKQAPKFGYVISGVITNIDQLRAAWAGYSVSGNDTHSYFGPTLNPGFAQ